MDAAALKRAALAARTFSVEDGERKFEVRLPTRHELAVECMRAGITSMDALKASDAGWLIVRRALAVRGIVGWRGVTVGDVLPEADETGGAVDFDAQLVPILLDADEPLAARIEDEILARVMTRMRVAGDLEKNSSSVAPGSPADARTQA
jgi:hypothetical protein